MQLSSNWLFKRYISRHLAVLWEFGAGLKMTESFPACWQFYFEASSSWQHFSFMTQKAILRCRYNDQEYRDSTHVTSLWQEHPGRRPIKWQLLLAFHCHVGRWKSQSTNWKQQAAGQHDIPGLYFSAWHLFTLWYLADRRQMDSVGQDGIKEFWYLYFDLRQLKLSTMWWIFH